MKQLLLLILCIFQVLTLKAQYCSSTASTADYEWIASVRFDTRTHYSGPSSGYEDFYGGILPFRAVPGSCYNMNIEVDYAATNYQEYFAVWIDLNHDGDFFDPGEEIFKTFAGIVGGVGANITIPASATLGETRMRVSMKYGFAVEPCDEYAYGEVEDYMIQLLPEEPTCPSAGLSTDYEYIKSVKINNVDNYSGDNGGYFSDFCGGNYLNMGMENELVLEPGFYGNPSTYPEVWKVWIDYNKNDSFEDVGEVVHISAPNEEVEIFNLTIPTSLISDEMYRMRVSMRYNSAVTSSCSAYSWGEVEDYEFVVKDPLGVATLLQEESHTRAFTKVKSSRVKESVKINPNPADQFINISFKYERDIPASYRIINMQGAIMEEKAVDMVGEEIRVSVHDYPNGYYLFQSKICDDWNAVPFIVLH